MEEASDVLPALTESENIVAAQTISRALLSEHTFLDEFFRRSSLSDGHPYLYTKLHPESQAPSKLSNKTQEQIIIRGCASCHSACPFTVQFARGEKNGRPYGPCIPGPERER